MNRTDAKSDRTGLKFFLIVIAWLAVLAGLAVKAFAQAPAVDAAEKPKTTQPAEIDGMKVTGPYVHKNLAVYLIHNDKRDDREFLTLNEGLKSGKVKVSELKNEQVSRLMIENTSDKPLFLQEGDRVTGGKQDRTIYSSLVIAPKSGKQAIPAFCIEQSRWKEGDTGRQFVGNANPGYASNGVRIASKLSKSQGRVWKEVAEQKMALKAQIGTGDKTSSLNEAIDSKKIKDATKGYKGELGKLLAKHGDAVGIAFALDGELTEVNVYPGNPLATKVYPRLLETYAVDASISKNAKKKPKTPTAAEVKAMMKSRLKGKAERDEKLNGRNRLQIFASEEADASKKHTYRAETKYGDDLVHLQWLRADKSVATASPADNEQIQQSIDNFLPNLEPEIQQRSVPANDSNQSE
ncbi:MAG: hypothetical protein MI757_05455 [Pirellulales bacterium]|nr:hypothetical protein [Pirellulales bacterium]